MHGSPHEASVPVFQFVGIGSTGPCQKLITHAYSENRLAAFHCLAEVCDGNVAELGVSGTVGNEQAIIFKSIEIVVPRYPDDLDTPFHETTKDIVLHAAVHHDNGLGAVPISNRLLAADKGYLVCKIGIIHGGH